MFIRAQGVDSLTKLLLHCNGANTSVIFRDDSQDHATITAAVTAQISTAQSRFGGSSLLLDGNSDYLTVPSSANWDFGTGNLTWDMWVQFVGTSGEQIIISRGAVADNYYFVKDATTHKLRFIVITNTSTVVTNYVMTNNWSVSTDTWYHLAVVRNGTTVLIFIDGISQAVTESTAIADKDITGAGGVLNIGCHYDNSSLFNGYMDEIRISKGVARWTGNFTKPTMQYGGGIVT